MADGGASRAGAFDIRQIAEATKVTKRAVEMRATREGWPFTEQAVRGGRRRLYVLNSLPADVQAAVLLASNKQPVEAASKAGRTAITDAEIKAAWARYEAAAQPQKDAAKRRLTALQAVERLVEEGRGLMDARAVVAAQLQREGVRGGSVASLMRWASDVAKLPRDAWLPALLSGYVGCVATADIPARAWDWYKGHYLTQAKPTHAETYRRLEEIAPAHGWALPSARTFERRMESEVSRVSQVLMREGSRAASMLLPTQDRDSLVFGVGEAVNGDGLKFDRLRVRFEDGEVLETATAWFWQDLHSRKILAWRLDKTENTDVFRLATYDLTGVCAPSHVWVDNTRVAANKLMTAGASGRHRFKSDPEDGLGLLLMLGMDPHFTNPDKESGNPGSKPIERAFGIGGLHEMVATNPRVVAAGGYSAATAIDAALLREVITEEVARFNARKQRKTQACRGVLSYDDAWQAGLQARPPRVLTDSQRRLLLMSREVVKADPRNGELRIEAGRGQYARNAYWCEHLVQYAGNKVAVHFDPDNLGAGVHVYSLDGRYLFLADHIERGAFNDTSAGREHGKLRRRVAKSNKEIAANEARMSALERAAMYAAKPQTPAPAAPEPVTDSNVIAGVFARVPDPQRDAQQMQRTGTDDRDAQFGDLMSRLAAKQNAAMGFVADEEDA